VKPEPNPEIDQNLPHITIEMPVYKESLEETMWVLHFDCGSASKSRTRDHGVVFHLPLSLLCFVVICALTLTHAHDAFIDYSAPSVYSLKKAMQTYARQGGTSAIFVHDDGLQSMSKEEQQKRINFYTDHNIGWVARPAHSNEPDGFHRAGRFKKASNMNYGLQVRFEPQIWRIYKAYNALQLSLCMEKHILALEATGDKVNRNSDMSLEDKALEMAIEEMYESTGSRWKPWARNARSLRVGDIILIVDSDTIVPEVSKMTIRQVRCQLTIESHCH